MQSCLDFRVVNNQQENYVFRFSGVFLPDASQDEVDLTVLPVHDMSPDILCHSLDPHRS